MIWSKCFAQRNNSSGMATPQSDQKTNKRTVMRMSPRTSTTSKRRRLPPPISGLTPPVTNSTPEKVSPSLTTLPTATMTTSAEKALSSPSSPVQSKIKRHRRVLIDSPSPRKEPAKDSDKETPTSSSATRGSPKVRGRLEFNKTSSTTSGNNNSDDINGDGTAAVSSPISFLQQENKVHPIL